MNLPLLELVVNRLQQRVREGDTFVLELASWLGLPGIEPPFPANEASGLLWSPREVGLAGLRHASGRSMNNRPFAMGLAALMNREYFVPYSPGVLEADPLAILAIAIGVQSLKKEESARWIADIAQRAILDEVDPWRIALLKAAGVLVGESSELPQQPEMVVVIANKCDLVSDTKVSASALSASLTLDEPSPEKAVFRLRALHLLSISSFNSQSAAIDNSRPTPSTLPRHCTVLLVSASPDGVVRLRTDKEFRNIIERVRGSRFRESFKFIQVQAARYGDLVTALQEHQPKVLHLSAHGEPDGSLLFEGVDEMPQKLPKKKFLKLLKALADDLCLVLLNACNSEALAQEIPAVIGLAIGMSDGIENKVAIEFSLAFYESLAFGKSIETAFSVALAGLDDVNDKIPQLFPTASQDLESKRRHSLV